MRKNRRLDFGIIAYNRKNKNSVGFISNLSSSGCFIETKETIPLNTSLPLEFELPDSLQTIKTDALVVRIKKNGIGVTFTLSDIQRTMVKQFVSDFSKGG